MLPAHSDLAVSALPSPAAVVTDTVSVTDTVVLQVVPAAAAVATMAAGLSPLTVAAASLAVAAAPAVDPAAVVLAVVSDPSL